MTLSDQTPRILSIGKVCTRVFPDRGGPARYAFDLSNTLMTHGVKCHVVTSKGMYFSENIGIRRFPIRRMPFPAPGRSMGLLSSLMFALSFILVGILQSIITFTRHKVVLVHSDSPVLSGVVGLVVSRIMRCPHIYTVHGLNGIGFSWISGKPSKLSLVLESLVTRCSEQVVVVSSDYSQFIKVLGGHPIVIGSGIDFEKFHPVHNTREKELLKCRLGVKPESVVITSVGNFDLDEKVRGFEDLLHAYAQLEPTQRDRSCLLIVGSGKRYEHLLMVMEKLGLEEHVRFTGHRWNVSEILRASDVFVLASHHEGSPIALLEAAASGCACIGSNTGGIPDIIGTPQGLFSVGSRKELASKLMLATTDSAFRQTLASIQRSLVIKSFHWSAIALKTIQVYNRALRFHHCESGVSVPCC